MSDRTHLTSEAYGRQTRHRVPVIALHCSGAGASEWHSLAEALGDDYELLAPGHYVVAAQFPAKFCQPDLKRGSLSLSA